VIGGAKLLTSSLSAPFSIVGCYDLRGERGELANAELRRSVEYSIVISARGSHELGHAYVTWVRNVAGEPYPRFLQRGFYADAAKLGRGVWRGMEGEVIAEGVPQGEERSGVFDPRLVVVAHLTEEAVRVLTGSNEAMVWATGLPTVDAGLRHVCGRGD